MDPRDIFQNSDSVRITEISFNLITPPGAPGGMRQFINLCKPKAMGELNLILNTTTDFGLPGNRNIALTADLPLPSGQPPRVKWNVLEDGLNLSLGFGVTLNRIEGSVTCSFQEITPRSQGFACDNSSPRAVG